MARSRTVSVLAPALAILIGLGACTSGGGSGGSTAATVDRAAAGGGGAASAVPAAGPAPAGRSAAGSAGGPVNGGDPAVTTALDVGRAKIRVARMTVQLGRGVSVSARADAAVATATGAGGEVDSDRRTSGRYASATLVLRVPPDQLAGVLDELARLGVERSRDLETTDVTAEVADVNSRVDSARTAIARLRALYTHASRIGDIISLESQLSTRESDLESLQAQQRALAGQTSLAAITLSLVQAPRGAAAPPTSARDGSGFLGGLRSGWHAFVTAASAVAVGVGALLPFLVVALLVAAAGRLVWRRARPAGGPAPAPEPAPAP